MQQNRHNIKVIISGGGTGGHVFPAIAIANALKKSAPDTDILFVGAQGRMEMEKVPAAGYPIRGLNISGFHRGLTLKNLSFPFKVLAAMRHARAILREFAPDVAVGVGGYASGPLLKVAGRMGIPSVLQEQNSYPGITNKLLAKKAAAICVAYEGMEQFFPEKKIVFTGNPVRQDIAETKNLKAEACSHFGLDGARPVILLIGGSLGARTLNESIHGGLSSLADKGIQLIWQTGRTYVQTAREAALPFHDHVKVFDFITRMDYAYAAADIVISRAGAISISELCVARKPAILVPSPNVAEDHQTKNALALASKDAAILVSDAEAREKLMPEAIALINDHARQESLAKHIAALGRKDAAEQIAKIILNLAGNKK